MRTAYIAGNWKMNLDSRSAATLVDGLTSALQSLPGRDVGVFPPLTMVREVAERARGTSLRVGAQNCHQSAKGAFTGEVSAMQVKDAGATSVILGHSERRRDFGEDEALLAKKLAAALAVGLKPLLCVGERLEERDAGRTFDVVARQTLGALEPFSAGQLADLTIAYEPVWAIGTGRNATPAQAAEVHAHLRGVLANRFDASFAARTRILYGGSVTPDNAAALLSANDVDGALVGGASLDLQSFLAIVKATAANSNPSNLSSPSKPVEPAR